MQAAQLVGPGRFDVVELSDVSPEAGEVVVAMRSASICGSDLHVIFEGHYTGPYPMAPGRPGHEGIGTVIESRSERWSAGDVVLTVPLPGRGSCYATRQVIGEDFLLAVPPGVELDRALMAQQLGTVVFGFRRYWPTGRPAEGLKAAIVGAGSAGLFALQLARLAGFSVAVVSDLEPSRLDAARRLGAGRTVLAPKESFVEAVLEETAGQGADLVIEAAGFDSCRTDCIEAVRLYGRVGLFGLAEHTGLVPFPFHLAFQRACSIELAGQAQLENGLSSFAEALRLIEGGQISLEDFLERRHPLSEIQFAMETARDRGAIKVSVDLER